MLTAAAEQVFVVQGEGLYRCKGYVSCLSLTDNKIIIAVGCGYTEVWRRFCFVFITWQLTNLHATVTVSIELNMRSFDR